MPIQGFQIKRSQLIAAAPRLAHWHNLAPCAALIPTLDCILGLVQDWATVSAMGAAVHGGLQVLETGDAAAQWAKPEPDLHPRGLVAGGTAP